MEKKSVPAQAFIHTIRRQNICRLFRNLAEIPFTASEAELFYQPCKK